MPDYYLNSGLPERILEALTYELNNPIINIDNPNYVPLDPGGHLHNPNRTREELETNYIFSKEEVDRMMKAREEEAHLWPIVHEIRRLNDLHKYPPSAYEEIDEPDKDEDEY